MSRAEEHAEPGFREIAAAQALGAMRRWLKAVPQTGADRSLLTTHLWLSSAVAGQPSAFAAEQSMLRASRWASLRTVEERARYISRALGHRKQERVTPSMPKLCPKGGGSIAVLNDVQAVAPRLMTPGGPIRRLLLQIPPGAGKTCTYLGVMAPFVGNGHTIVVVGEPDVFLAFKGGLRACPARVFRRMLLPDGRSLAPETTVYLRDINPGMSAFCTLKTEKMTKELQGDPFECDADALTWLDTRVYFFDYVMAGNWMTAWAEQKKNKQGKDIVSKYHEINPFSDKLLLIVDEAHKLGIPSLEATTERWKAAAALFPKYMASLGKDKNTNPYILVGTATVNTTQNPVLSLCLPRVVKGFTDSRLFVDDDITQPPKVNLHTYLDPAQGFVRIATSVKVSAVAPPRAVGDAEESAVLPVKAVKDRLTTYRGFASDAEAAAKKGGAADKEEDLTHPCPVSAKALRDAAYFIYEPVDTAENRKKLLDIWAGVAYIVYMSKDFRYYPTTNEPYPMIRSVPLPEGTRAHPQSDYVKLLEKPKSSARWTEVSQFADKGVMVGMVKACLQGQPLDLEHVEFLAPKWKGVAEDLIEDKRLRGRSMVYPGTYNRADCDDNYYLLLLAFYLQAKLRRFVGKHCPGAKEHQLVTLESVVRPDQEAPRSAAPAIYILGDPTEGKYLGSTVAAHLKAGAAAVEAGRVPDAEDLVFMLSTRAFREKQYNRYNAEVCPGPDHVPQQAAGNAIILIGEGGHKALDLVCTSNGLILSTMPGGKFAQTQGRVKRSCAFKKLMDATSLWHVNVRIYLLWAEECLKGGPVIDQILHSFYHAQYQIVRYLEMVEAQAGIGCSNWELYSEWRKTFADFDGLPEGGFRCAHDLEPGERHVRNKESWSFFHCAAADQDPLLAPAEEIRRGPAGDVSPEAVSASTHGTCSRNAAAPLETAQGAIRDAARILRERRFADRRRPTAAARTELQAVENDGPALDFAAGRSPASDARAGGRSTRSAGHHSPSRTARAPPTGRPAPSRLKSGAPPRARLSPALTLRHTMPAQPQGVEAVRARLEERLRAAGA